MTRAKRILAAVEALRARRAAEIEKNDAERRAAWTRRFEQAARETYEAIGFDAFGGDATDEDEFVDVIRDQIGNGHNDLADDEIEMFRRLPLAEKRRIILTAL